MCVCLSLSLNFKNVPPTLYSHIISHRERERKETFRQKLSSASTKVVVVVPTKSQKSRFRFRRRLKCVVVCGEGKKSSKAISISSSIKGVVFLALTHKVFKGFFGPVSFFSSFLLSLSLSIGWSFFLIIFV